MPSSLVVVLGMALSLVALELPQGPTEPWSERAESSDGNRDEAADLVDRTSPLPAMVPGVSRSFGDKYDLAVQWFCALRGDYLVDTGSGPGPCLQVTYDGIPELCGANVFTGADVMISESETPNGDGTVTITVEVYSEDGSDLLPAGLTCSPERDSSVNEPIDTTGGNLGKADSGGPGVVGDALDPDLGVSPFEILDAEAVIFGSENCPILEFDLSSAGATHTDLKDRFTVGGVNDVTITAMQFRYRVAVGEPTGACCLPDDSCVPSESDPEPLTGVECATLGGTYQGDFTACPAPFCGTPVNDVCISAMPVTDGNTPFHTENATTDLDAPPPCAAGLEEEVWFSLTATCNGDLTVGTCDQGSGADTVLELFLGSDCATMTSDACADDTPGCGACGKSASITTATTLGSTYFIRVAGFGGQDVAGNLTIACVPSTTPTGACCEGGFCVGEDMTEAECMEDSADNDWTEGGICAEVCSGACCEPDGSCGILFEFTQATCESIGGTFLGNRVCGRGGCLACCLDDGTCRNTSEENCLSLEPPGTPGVDGQVCANITCGLANGSACTENAECQGTCVAGVCADVGSDGDTCDEADHDDCLSGGVCVAGVCELPTGACCMGGSCRGEALTEEACDAFGAETHDWHQGALCADVCTGICCDADGACITNEFFTQTECEAMGGTFIGNGSCSLCGCDSIGGPDSFGYTYRDSRAANGQLFVAFDISNTGFKVIGPGGTDSSIVSLMRPFRLYDRTYPFLRVSRHGYVTTDFEDDGQDNSPDCPLPAAPDTPESTTGARLYVYHADLEFDPDHQPTDSAGVYLAHFSTLNYPPGENEPATVIQWTGVRRVGETESLTAQLILFYDDERILMTYAGAPNTGGPDATIGIQSEPPGDGGAPNAGLVLECGEEDCVDDNGYTVLFRPPPRGACTFNDRPCTTQYTRSECVVQNGTFLGDETTCPVGACCLNGSAFVLDGPICAEHTEEECLTTDHGEAGGYQGDGTACADHCGACCTDERPFCRIAGSESECIDMSGAYAGSGTDCYESCVPGSCCMPGGPCIDDIALGDCIDMGGRSGTPGGTCADADCGGACCMPNGDCEDNLTASECESAGGRHQGDGVACSAVACEPEGACTFLDRSCAERRTPSTCDEQGGRYQGDGTTCSGGACCQQGGACADVSDEEFCGGTYRGDGTRCSTVSCRGGCCLGGNQCVDTNDEAACTASGGTFSGEGNICGVKFSFTALSPAARVNTCNSTYNTRVYVLDECGGVVLASNDDCAHSTTGDGSDPDAPCYDASGAAGEYQSCTCIPTEVGRTYYIRVTATDGGPAPSGSSTSIAVQHRSTCSVQRFGACCQSDGSCADSMSEDTCQSGGGQYAGHGSTCPSGGGCPCLGDNDCADSDLCNGVETCVQGRCLEGTPVECVDDDELFCNGTQVCEDGVCVPSDLPCDPVAEVCDDLLDQCNARCESDADCDDGLYCNGAEACSIVNGGCLPGTPPCIPPEVCVEELDECRQSCLNDAECDDGLFCNGSEVCGDGTCGPGVSPCDAEADVCDELLDQCAARCESDADCDDGVFCNGLEACSVVNSGCVGGSAPCLPGETCDEAASQCFKRGDADSDGDVDLMDVRGLFECFGVVFRSGTGCEALDASGDGVIDLIDFAEIVMELGGPL